MGAAEALGGSIHDRLNYARRVFIELVVPNTKNSATLMRQDCVPTAVSFGNRMVTPVEFDDQSRLAACKVDDIWADRKLAGEFGAVS